jgi:hypothetical protein
MFNVTEMNSLDFINDGESDIDYMLYISLLINFLLLLSTSTSEILASSKCKHNSVLELVGGLIRGEKACQRPDEDVNSNEDSLV